MLRCLYSYEEVTQRFYSKRQKMPLLSVFRACFLTPFSSTRIKLKYLMLVLSLSSFIWQMYQKILFGYWSYPNVKK